MKKKLTFAMFVIAAMAIGCQEEYVPEPTMHQNFVFVNQTEQDIDLCNMNYSLADKSLPVDAEYNLLYSMTDRLTIPKKGKITVGWPFGKSCDSTIVSNDEKRFAFLHGSRKHFLNLDNYTLTQDTEYEKTYTYTFKEGYFKNASVIKTKYKTTVCYCNMCQTDLTIKFIYDNSYSTSHLDDIEYVLKERQSWITKQISKNVLNPPYLDTEVFEGVYISNGVKQFKFNDPETMMMKIGNYKVDSSSRQYDGLVNYLCTDYLYFITDADFENGEPIDKSQTED